MAEYLVLGQAAVAVHLLVILIPRHLRLRVSWGGDGWHVRPGNIATSSKAAPAGTRGGQQAEPWTRVILGSLHSINPMAGEAS